MKSKKVYFAPWLALGLLVLAGCAMPVKPEDSSVIRQRAVERWNFLIAHQAEKAYDYLSPGYRATKSREEYAKEMNNRPVRWKTAKFVEQKCDQDVCDVVIEVTYLAKVNAGTEREVESTSQVNEHWIREQGKWYLLPESRVTAPRIPPRP